MTNNEREIRAFESIIVSQILRARDPMDLKDLPELTEAQKKVMGSRPSTLVEQLWAEVENEPGEEPCPAVCDLNERVDEEEFVGMNRAEVMDEETRKALDEARKEVIESMKKQKEQGGANA